MPSIHIHCPPVNPDLLTIREAAKETRLSQDDLKMLMRAGRLRYLRAGLSVWLRREDVERMKGGAR